jgi:hypothetical protein
MRATIVLLAGRSALALLVVGIALADDADHASAAHELAVLAHLLD